MVVIPGIGVQIERQRAVARAGPSSHHQAVRRQRDRHAKVVVVIGAIGPEEKHSFNLADVEHKYCTCRDLCGVGVARLESRRSNRNRLPGCRERHGAAKEGIACDPRGSSIDPGHRGPIRLNRRPVVHDDLAASSVAERQDGSIGVDRHGLPSLLNSPIGNKDSSFAHARVRDRIVSVDLHTSCCKVQRHPRAIPIFKLHLWLSKV